MTSSNKLNGDLKRKTDYILKLNVVAKKSRAEIKKILKVASFLLQSKLCDEFRKSKKNWTTKNYLFAWCCS